MKKILLPICLLATICNTTSAQVITQVLQAAKPQKAFEGTPILDKKSFVFSVGFGIPNNTTTLLSAGGIVGTILNNGTSSNKSGFGPVFAGMEYFVSKDLSIGLSGAYANGKQNYTSGGIPIIGIPATSLGTASINLFQIAATSSYHLYTTDKLDPYIKGAIGLNIWKTKYVTTTGESNPFNAPTPFGYQGLVGLRYFVSKKLAPYGEIGYTSLRFSANIGLSVKL
jgi:Outer membrane protein beta-barrel domain